MMLWLTLRQLKSKQAAARRRAAEALCQSPTSRAFDALTTALAEDEDPDVRRHVATAIGKLEIEEERRVEALLNGLRDQHPDVLKAVLAGLKNARDERVQPALVPLLHNTDPGVRGHASTMLYSRGWRPDTLTLRVNLYTARGDLDKAVALGVPAIPALERVIQTGSFHQRVAAVEALGRIDDNRVLKPLLAAMGSSDPAVAAAAVSSMGHAGDEQNFEAVAKMLRHEEGHVRTVTVESLARLDPERAVEPVTGMLKDRVWDVRRAAAVALGKLKDTRAVPALIAGLQDDDADVREAVATALGLLRDRSAIGPLVKAMTDSASGVRRLAATALTRIDEDWSVTPEAKAAIEELKVLLLDSEKRYLVGSLLKNLGFHTPETDLLMPQEMPSSTPEKRRKLAASLLLSTLKDYDSVLRQVAAEALGRLGEHRAESALQNARRDPAPSVRLAVEHALRVLRPTREAS
jgi:HEAT repeat protein